MENYAVFRDSVSKITGGKAYAPFGDDGYPIYTDATSQYQILSSIFYENGKIIFNFQLYPNYPNPFNPETTIKYNLPADQLFYQVKVKIYDALGRLTSTLINELQNPGLNTVKWNGKSAAGQNMTSGIYFCFVHAGQYKATQKMLLVR